ncbi:hypothetical protein R1flu_011274 [Riccia fluitans]|uniref:Uncharacterized protein n=1 Tax=Riccia fluitans TaxID=41844 RepID=A0ABD1ZAI4_9MARC
MGPSKNILLGGMRRKMGCNSCKVGLWDSCLNESWWEGKGNKMAKLKDGLHNEMDDNQSFAIQLVNVCSKYENLKANLKEANMSHLIESSDQTIAKTENANDGDGLKHQDTATADYQTNIIEK